jgi:uncharacterized membrane protein YkoI
MTALGLMIVLLFILSGCNDMKKNHTDRLISEKEALRIAQKNVQDSKVIWSAAFKENEKIEMNNRKEKRNVWIVEADFPAGNKEIYKIDAKDGRILVITEQEANGR